MSEYLLGSVVNISTTNVVAGVLTDDATMTLTITKPDGTTATPSFTHPGVGTYLLAYLPASAGHYRYTWESANGIDSEEFDVLASARNIIDVDDLKAWLGRTVTDIVDDATLTVAAASANRATILYCKRSFEYVPVGSETTRTYRIDDSNSHRLVYIDDFHSATNLVIKTDDGDTGTFSTTWVNATDVEVEPLNGLDGGMPVPYYRLRAVGNRWFPRYHRHASLQVTAAWGWASIPDDVFNATLMKAAKLWKRKNTPEGVLGYADMAVRVSNREDPDVAALLNPYVRVDRTIG